MIPVEQVILGPPDGDCFAACVASILELPIDRVPNFKNVEHEDGTVSLWFDLWREWLRPSNLSLVFIPIESYAPSGYGILSVKSARFEGNTHAVVVLDGRGVWNPYPGAPASEAETQERNWFYAVTVLDPTVPVNLSALPEVSCEEEAA